MTQFRIYYESLEQANDYIRPLINAVADPASIVLVKRPRSSEGLPHGVVQAIQLLTTPDVLITGIKDNTEYPLALLEFSEAVATEDHELQRTYGAVASYLAEMFYIKISGNKQSEKVFGGAEYNPFSTPKILLDEFDYEGYIIADWDTQTDNLFTLLRNCDYPSCPPVIDILRDTIQTAVVSFLADREAWYANSIAELKTLDSYAVFREEVDKAPGSVALLTSWKGRGDRTTNRNKLRYFVTDDWIGAKINRFSHAMDPDRGILTFISFIFSAERKIYGIYALVRPRGADVLKGDMVDLDSLKTKFTHALEKDKGGIPSWFVEELETAVNGAESLDQEIDFQDAWERHKDKIESHKVVATIAYFLDGMYLNHNGLRLVWNRKALLGDDKAEFLTLLKEKHGFGVKGAPGALSEEASLVDEDEVTYAIVHRILIPNKFRIVSISYPGSQGGGAILPQPELGKAQPREYPDIIALPPEDNDHIDVILGESKGSFSQTSLEKETAKLLKYKDEEEPRKALRETLIVAKVIGQNNDIKNILIGVAFGATTATQTVWQPAGIDFIFRITDRSKWAIGIFNQALSDLITHIEGDTDFPTVYRLDKLS